MSNSSNNIEFFMRKHEGVKSIKEGVSEVESLRFGLSGAIKNPVIITFSPKAVNINNKYWIEFTHIDEEIGFLHDVYFALEEVNEVPTEQRLTDGLKVTTLEQIIEQAKRSSK